MLGSIGCRIYLAWPNVNHAIIISPGKGGNRDSSYVDHSPGYRGDVVSRSRGRAHDQRHDDWKPTGRELLDAQVTSKMLFQSLISS